MHGVEKCDDVQSMIRASCWPGLCRPSPWLQSHAFLLSASSILRSSLFLRLSSSTPGFLSSLILFLYPSEGLFSSQPASLLSFLVLPPSSSAPLLLSSYGSFLSSLVCSYSLSRSVIRIVQGQLEYRLTGQAPCRNLDQLLSAAVAGWL